MSNIENHHQMRKAQKEGLIHNVYKVWSTAMDGRSCSLCAKMEGTAIALDEPFVVAGRSLQVPPLHNHCRCALLYVEEQFLKPAPIRALKAFTSFLSLAKESDDFIAAVNGYHAAVFFLHRLSGFSDAELMTAGLKERRAFLADHSALVADRDDIFNRAIMRAYNRTVSDAASLKTERGRRARVDRFLQATAVSQELSPANFQLLLSLSNKKPL